MKINHPVIDKAFPLSDDAIVISTTDLKGIITSVNGDFCHYSGFSAEELIGKNHNIVRHPDMPPAAFEDLWNHLKQGKSWLGIVKNRRKDGSYYWVNAFVAPLYQGEEIVAYQSVRTKPRQEWIDRAEIVYRSLNHRQHPLRTGQSSLERQIFFTLTALLSLFSITGLWLGRFAPMETLIMFLAGLLLSWFASRMLVKPLRAIAMTECSELECDPVRLWIYTGRNDELGKLQLAKLVNDAKEATIKARVFQYADELSTATALAANRSKHTKTLAEEQRHATKELSIAIGDLETATSAVSTSADTTAETVREVLENAGKGRDIAAETKTVFQQLAQEVEQGSNIIDELARESKQIDSMIEIIKKISDQTSLLALNAAIEAARAGELGRGFAIVADEVRSLSAETQHSAKEIEQLVNQLQKNSEAAVTAMKMAKSNTRTGTKKVSETEKSLELITAAIANISDMATHIASSSDRQNNVAKKIAESTREIREKAIQTSSDSKDTMQATHQLTSLAQQLKELVANV